MEEQIDNNENIIILDTKEEYISKYYETLKDYCDSIKIDIEAKKISKKLIL